MAAMAAEVNDLFGMNRRKPGEVLVDALQVEHFDREDLRAEQFEFEHAGDRVSSVRHDCHREGVDESRQLPGPAGGIFGLKQPGAAPYRPVAIGTGG